MNNGDMPAMPTNPVESIGNTTITRSYVEGGLTKREHFAGLAMQSVCIRTSAQTVSSEMVAIVAVEMADALLKELDK